MVDAGFHGHYVADLQNARCDAVQEGIFVDQQAHAMAGSVREPVAEPRIGDALAAGAIDVVVVELLSSLVVSIPESVL